MPSAGDSLRRTVRRSTRRATGAAAERYRAAVLEQSRWLPTYLIAVDAADLARRTARAVRRRPSPEPPWAAPDPAVATVQRAGLSGTGELSLVLAGPAGWRESISVLALASHDETVHLSDALVERVAERVQLCASVPWHQVPPGRWRVVVLDRAGRQLPDPAVASRAAPAWARRDAARLEIDAGALSLVRSADARTPIEHRVRTGIARLLVEWTPPPGAAPELVLLDREGRVVSRITASPEPRRPAVAAVIDAATLGTGGPPPAELVVAAAHPDRPVPLALGPVGDPPMAAAPDHGSAVIAAHRVVAGYDADNHLVLRVRPVEQTRQVG